MTSPKIATAADLASKLPTIRWLWPGWLPIGFVTILAGNPGVGKSMCALELARSVIEPADWPDRVKGPTNQGYVLWCDTESSQALLSERITTWKLPADRILLPGNDPLATISLSSQADRIALIGSIKNFKPNMVVVDSLSAAHRGDENSTRDMKNVLDYLAQLARDENVAVLVVHHLRKKGMNESEEINLDRVRGSSVITSFARVVMAMERVGEGVRLSVIKNNLARLLKPLGITINDSGLTFGAAPERASEPTKTDVAVSWLRKTLRDNPLPFKELEPKAKAHGISKRQLYNARDILGVKTEDGHWTLRSNPLVGVFGDTETE